MRVLYLIDSLSRGGAEQSLAALAPHYHARGVHLTVGYLAERPGLRAELESGGVRVVSLAGRGGRFASARRARDVVAQFRPDLVHTTLFEADLAGRTGARLAGAPVVSSLVNEAYGPAQIGDRRLRRWKVEGARLADAATARLVTRFHAVSDRVADVMSARLGIRPERVEVVPRGRDPERLGMRTAERRRFVRAVLEVPERAPLIVAVGRQEYQKGLDVLLAAVPEVLARCPDAVVLIAGREGNQTTALQASAERPELRGAVRFLGQRDDVPDLLAAADVLTVPTRWEGLPGVLLEAMALGTPVVASDIPQVREAVGRRDAVLVPPERPSSLAGALVTVLGDPAPAGARASRAQQRFAERFAIEGVADRMLAFYDRALVTPLTGLR